jgi:membrane peptidoglycan carboxypeptidase
VPQLTTVTWVGYPTSERPMRNVHGIAGVTGGTLPAEIWHTYMTSALHGQPVEQFPSAGAPPYKAWCGRYQFARTWQDAKKKDGCKHQKKDHKKKHKKHQHKKKTTTEKTTTRKSTTVHTTTQVTTRQTTTAPPPTTTTRKPPPTTTTTATTTTTTTTTPTTTTSGEP